MVGLRQKKKKLIQQKKLEKHLATTTSFTLKKSLLI